MAPKRGRNDKDDDKGGPSKVQLRGLSWNTSAAQPAFLKNALSALQGPKPARDLGAESGRPEIPTRPDGEGEESEEDEWDLGRGEEAPAVVVLREGKHVDRDEVDRIRAEAKSSSLADPLASSSAPAAVPKNTGSLNFSSSASGAPKAKVGSGEVGTESWEDVIARSKAEAAKRALVKEEQEKEDERVKEKERKRKVKEKKAAKKKVGLLSFGDDE